jgi:hypothetical protein
VGFQLSRHAADDTDLEAARVASASEHGLHRQRAGEACRLPRHAAIGGVDGPHHHVRPGSIGASGADRTAAAHGQSPQGGERQPTDADPDEDEQHRGLRQQAPFYARKPQEATQ